ncbi:hypothetical protein M15_01600 [Atrimonas thermophila]
MLDLKSWMECSGSGLYFLGFCGCRELGTGDSENNKTSLCSFGARER